MKYEKAQDVLPPILLEQLQQYADGVYLYIPKKEGHKQAWGSQTTTKAKLVKRNEQIYADFLQGMSIQELSTNYFLVEQSIRRILRTF